MADLEFFVPSGYGTGELQEKKSRFIAQLWQVHEEDEAKAHIEATRKQYHDARHHCWCYCLDQSTLRYSDDGEPQGTGGHAMLEMFQKEKLQEYCCVVTRYYGGIQLGTGGLQRAYTHSAKASLESVGRSVYKKQLSYGLQCGYSFFETVQKLATDLTAEVTKTDYGAEVNMELLLPVEKKAQFLSTVGELSAGQVCPTELGEVFQLVPFSP